MYRWKVVPLCREQLLDIKSEDVLPGGVFRTCDVYKSGGGYDKFPQIYERRYGIKTNPKQFVVQLYGCHLKCPYCYVTPNGIWGKYLKYTSEELMLEFLKSGCQVFHLMGGSPALYIDHWGELIDKIENVGGIFHSDLTLTEKRYSRSILRSIASPISLYAVNIKGVSPEDYEKNTGTKFNNTWFWLNLYELVVCNVPFYITFTNPNMNQYNRFIGKLMEMFNERILDDSFIIDLVEYEAVKTCSKEG